MNNSWFFGVIAYLFIASAVAGALPSDFYSGTHNDVLDSSEFRDTALSNVDDVDNFGGQLNFFQKILTFLFVTWEIEDIPVFFALVLLFVNLSSILIVSIWFYDKIRGIP